MCLKQFVCKLIKIGMLRSIARLSFSPTRCLAPVRPFFFSASESSPPPSPTTFATASVDLNKASSADISDQKPTDNQARPKKKLSHQAQSAIWAERVIQYILIAKPLKDIHSYTLREQIMKLQNPDDVHQFESEPKEKVMRLFTQGVILNSFVFDQKRIKDGAQNSQKNYQENSQKQKQDKNYQQNQLKNFIFCPNLIVTKQIFNLMMKLSANFLLTGGFGISKTVSVILFIQLSNYVNSYLFKVAQPNQELRNELAYLKELQPNRFFFDQGMKDQQLEHQDMKLPAYKKYFSRTIPRYWYWSISPEEQDIQQQLRQILLLQAPQLSQQKQNELSSIKEFKEFVRQLKKCYPHYKSYCMKVVVDQFNAVASLARQWNRKVNQYKMGTITLAQYNRYEKSNQQPAQKTIELMKSAFYLSNLPKPRYILNSSTSIQKNLLNSYRGKLPQEVYFNIQNEHGQLFTKEIKYLQEIKESLIDFLHNFWFEIERKLKIVNKDKMIKKEEQIKDAIKDKKDNAEIQKMKEQLVKEEKKDNQAIPQMKSLFLQEVDGKKANYFSRFLFVRQYLTQKKILQIKQKYNVFKQKQGKAQNPFKGIYEQFTQKSTSKYRQKVKSFIKKDQTYRTFTLLYALYDIAVLQSYKADQKDKELTVNVKDLTRRIQENPFKWIDQGKYNEILPFTLTQNQESIKFFWKPKQFTQAIMDILFKIQGTQSFNPHVRLGYERYCCHRGIFFEHCLIQSLRKGAHVTFRCPKNTKQKELIFEISQDRFTNFQSFNRAYEGNHSFEAVLKTQAQAKANKDIYIKNYKLKKKRAKEYIESFNQGKPQSQQISQNSHDVYKIRTSTISRNLSGLLDTCDKYPHEFIISTPHKQQQYDDFSECIDFIIARKSTVKYQIYTFDVSISRTTAKPSKAQKFFNQILKRQKGNHNYTITHIVLCHSDAERPVSYDSSKQLNIIYSPWSEMTIRQTKNKFAYEGFQKIQKICRTIHDKEEELEENEEDEENEENEE